MLHIAGLDFTPDQAEASGSLCDSVDQPIDDFGVENLSQPPRAIGKRPDDKSIIDLIDIIFVE